MTARGAGAFGKMPGMGDFLRLDLPAGFTRAWDTWLQAGLISARDRALGHQLWRPSIVASDGTSSDRPATPATASSGQSTWAIRINSDH